MSLNKRSDGGRRGRTAEDVLDAAARAFARSGYQGATMRDIAEEAGCTAPALYTYFDSKQALLQGLIERLLGDLVRLFDEPLPRSLAFEQRLEVLVQRQLALTEHRRDELVLCFSPTALTALAAAQATGAAPKPFEDFMSRLIAWVRENVDPATEARAGVEELAHLLIGLEYAYFLDWMRSGARGGPAASAEKVVERLLRGVRGAG